MVPSVSEMILRIGLAFIVGFLVGFERETRGRPAGLRTLILVCVSSAVAMILSEQLIEIEQRLIPTGLHAFGRAAEQQERADLLRMVVSFDRPEQGVLETTCGPAAYKHNTYRAEDFPKLREVEGAQTFTVDSAAFP